MKLAISSVVLMAGLWSGAQATEVWVYQPAGADPVTVNLQDNQAGTFTDVVHFLLDGSTTLGLKLTPDTGVNFSNVTLNGTALNQSGGSWSTSGSGIPVTGNAMLTITGTTNGLITNKGSTLVGTVGGSSIPSPVPEPATWAMSLAGLAALGGLARRRKAR